MQFVKTGRGVLLFFSFTMVNCFTHAITNSLIIPNQLPAIVELMNSDSTSSCSGTIIGVDTNALTVSTSAHCVVGLKADGLVLVPNGKNELTSWEERPKSKQVFVAGEYALHPLVVENLELRNKIEASHKTLSQNQFAFDRSWSALSEIVMKMYPDIGIPVPNSNLPDITGNPEAMALLTRVNQLNRNLRTAVRTLKVLETQLVELRKETTTQEQDQFEPYDLAVVVFQRNALINTMMGSADIKTLIEENKVLPIAENRSSGDVLLVGFGSSIPKLNENEASAGSSTMEQAQKQDARLGARQLSVFVANQRFRKNLFDAFQKEVTDTPGITTLMSAPLTQAPPSWPTGYMGAALHGDSGGAMINSRGIYAVTYSFETSRFEVAALPFPTRFPVQVIEEIYWNPAPLTEVHGVDLNSPQSKKLLAQVESAGAPVIYESDLIAEGINPNVVSSALFDVIKN